MIFYRWQIDTDIDIDIDLHMYIHTNNTIAGFRPAVSTYHEPIVAWDQLFERVIGFFACSHHGWLQGRKIRVLTHLFPMYPFSTPLKHS